MKQDRLIFLILPVFSLIIIMLNIYSFFNPLINDSLKIINCLFIVLLAALIIKNKSSI